MSASTEAVLVIDCRNRHGEGVVWAAEHGLLMWTDIEGRALWTHNPATGATTTFDLPERLCCFAPRRGRPPHEILSGFASGFAFFDCVTGAREPIVAFEPELAGTRLNDGRTDPFGRFIAGGMDEADAAAARSSVVLLDHDLSLRQLFGGVACANSIAFSPDGATMYFADSPTGVIEAFDYDGATAAPSNRRAFVRTGGIPDGSCVDREGYLWNAVWEGYRVERYAPDGRLDRIVEVPVAKPTCCAFGGNDLSTLYITTSRLGSDVALLEREPQSGGVFAVRPGVAGLPSPPFG